MSYLSTSSTSHFFYLLLSNLLSLFCNLDSGFLTLLHSRLSQFQFAASVSQCRCTYFFRLPSHWEVSLPNSQCCVGTPCSASPPAQAHNNSAYLIFNFFSTHPTSLSPTPSLSTPSPSSLQFDVGPVNSTP